MPHPRSQEQQQQGDPCHLGPSKLSSRNTGDGLWTALIWEDEV